MATARRWILGAPMLPTRSMSARTIASPRWLRLAARRTVLSRHYPSSLVTHAAPHRPLKVVASSPLMLVLSCRLWQLEEQLIGNCTNKSPCLWLLVASEGSVKSAGSRKVDPKCPNAGNPFHECGEHCAAKMQQVEQHKGASIKSPRKKGEHCVLIGLLNQCGNHAQLSSWHCNVEL